MQLTDLPQQIVFGLAIGAVYALVAIGFSLVFRTMGLLSFVHPQFVALGSVLGYTAVPVLGLPVWLSIVPVALLTGLVAFVVDQIGIRPIRERGGSLVAMILATVGWGIVVVNGVRLTYGAFILSYATETFGFVDVLGVSISAQSLIMLTLAVLLMLALYVLLKYTPTGWALRAAGDDPATAALMGIDVQRVMGISAAIGGALGGAAGILLGWAYFAGYTLGVVGVKSLAAAVLGGFGSIPGAVLGGLVLGLIDNFTGVLFESSLRDALVFSVIIVVLLFWPRGLLGRPEYVRS